jgi:hypothetical protein
MVRAQMVMIGLFVRIVRAQMVMVGLSCSYGACTDAHGCVKMLTCSCCARTGEHAGAHMRGGGDDAGAGGVEQPAGPAPLCAGAGRVHCVPQDHLGPAPRERRRRSHVRVSTHRRHRLCLIWTRACSGRLACILKAARRLKCRLHDM